MLAYRHAFHAGNHADVFKHLVLVQVLHYMNLKDKPYRFIDTHAGAGMYSLRDHQARLNSEFANGVARLWHSREGDSGMPSAVKDYLDLVRAMNPGGQLTAYPGSPALARKLLRPIDQMRLFELHPTDHRLLCAEFAGQRQVQVHATDGFDGLKGQVPPSSRRAVVLMDPSYEGHRDYGRVVTSLREAITRFADGVYMVWYPQVAKVESSQLPRRLKSIAPKGWLHASLTVQQPDAQGFGLTGSGVFILNPPYTLHATLGAVLPWLVRTLGQYRGATHLLEQHAV